MATKIPEFGIGTKGYGDALFMSLYSIRDALPQHSEGGQEELLKSFRQAQDHILANSGGEHGDYVKTVSALYDIAEKQPSLRKEAIETATRLYNSVEVTDGSFDDAVKHAFNIYAKDPDVEMRRIAARAAAKLGVAAVTTDHDKKGFAQFLTDAFNAEKDGETMLVFSSAIFAMELAEEGILTERAAALGQDRGPLVSVELQF